MVHHIILWKCSADIPDAELNEKIELCRRGFAALPGKINGLISMRLITTPLSSSSCDLMLDSVFTDAAALAAYKYNPDHVAVATVIRSIISERVCMDYEE